MVLLEVWILERLPFQKAHHYAAYTIELSVNVSVRLIC